MEKVNLTLLGGIRLQTDPGKPVSLSTRKAGALLAYLALHPGRAQPRAKLAALLWGESGETQARDSLRQALSLVRKALLHVDSRALIAHEDTVSFEPTALTTDAIVFGDLVSQADTGRLEEAIALYGGEFLDGFQVRAPEFERWVTTERERFRELAVQAMTRLLDHHLSTGAVEPGVRTAARLLATDPLQEHAHRILMELYYRQGRYAAALRQYQTCAELLAKELGIEPDAATKALRREIVRRWNKPREATSSDDVAPTPLGDLEPESPGVQPTLALPDKPSIAVLPFQNMSDDPEQDYFADGIVEEIITALSRFRQLFVIARNSSFTYKGRAVDVKQVGRELGVRYVLEGSVRRAGNRVRVAGQLIDASTAAHLWADRFEGALDDIFDLQDRVTANVVGAIAPKLEWAEIERRKHKPTESLDAYDHYLRGVASFHRGLKETNREANDEALRLLYKTVELDPEFSSAYGLATLCYWRRTQHGWTVDRMQETAEAQRLARRVAELGHDDAFALSVAGFALAWLVHDLSAAAALTDRALASNPNLESVWRNSGWVKIILGEPELAIEHFTRSMRLNPRDPLMFVAYQGISLAHFCAGRYDDASSWAEKALGEAPNYAPALRAVAAADALAGRLEGAQKAIARMRELDSAYRISDVKKRFPTRRPEDIARFEEGLRIAGLPE